MIGQRQSNLSPGKLLKHLRVPIIVLVVLSAYQYIKQGEITWPAETLDKIGDYAERPEAGWRRAADALNSAIPAKGVPATFDLSGRVVRVIDGDTISLLDQNNDQHNIRLHGIDTPEQGQSFSEAASQALSGMVVGEVVGIEAMDIDRHERTVGVVWLDGVNINLEMVKLGYAWWYRQHARYNDELRDAEAMAKGKGLGLWADSDPVPPWDWLKGRRVVIAP